jgi:hypothetical protein
MTAVSKFTTPSAAGTEVNRRAEAHMSEHQGISYQEAMAVVLKADKELAKAYGQPAPEWPGWPQQIRAHSPPCP